MAAVEVDGLVVRYGEVTAVDGASFEAAAGEVTAVLGPNGAGKTTTIEALEGFRRPDAGRVAVVGLDPIADHAALTTRIGVMLQAGGVGPGVRVLEALRHAAALYAHPLDPQPSSWSGWGCRGSSAAPGARSPEGSSGAWPSPSR